MTRPGRNDGESNLLRPRRNPCRKRKRNRIPVFFPCTCGLGGLLYVDTFRHLEVGGCVGGDVLHPSSFGVGPWFLRSVVCWLWSNAVVEGSSPKFVPANGDSCMTRSTT